MTLIILDGLGGIAMRVHLWESGPGFSYDMVEIQRWAWSRGFKVVKIPDWVKLSASGRVPRCDNPRRGSR